MCVIIHILPGSSVEHDRLFNAAANNWHSWGIIVKGKDGLKTWKKVPQGAELADSNPKAGGCWQDIEEITKILDDNKEYHRYVHFRHATRGDVSLDNCHPFLAFKDEDREVFLMHNGSFVGGLGGQVWSPHNTNYGPGANSINTDSDTKEFVEKHLSKALKAFGINGDYTNRDFQDFIWNPLYNSKGGSSKIILISNDLPELKAGTWDTFVDSKTQEPRYYASNNTYFRSVDRGPLFYQQKEKERRQKEEEEIEKRKTLSGSNSSGKTDTEVTQYRAGMFEINSEIIKGLHAVFETFGSGLAPGDIADLGECSVPEFEAIVNKFIASGNTLTIAHFLDVVMTSYMELYQENERLKDKHDKATKLISSLKTTASQENFDVTNTKAA